MYKENLNDLKRYLIPKILSILKIDVCIFLLAHIVLMIFFFINKIWLMGIVNIISVITYMILGYKLIVLNKQKKNNLIDDISCFSRISDVVLLELYIHMILAVISVGWEANFQIYCFAMIVFLMLNIYLTSTKLRVLFELSLLCFTYISLRILTIFVPPIYGIFSEYASIFDLLNTVLTLIFTSIIIVSLSTLILDFDKHLANKANYDRLTGLANRSFIDNLDYSDATSCVMILDIDNFKSINDTYGHDAGDEVLKKLSDILKKYEKMDENFKAIRWGGEEFVILVDTSNYKYFKDIAEKLRKEVENSLIVSDLYAIKYTITVGIAYAPESKNYTDLIKKADNRLYEGKRTGKNKVIERI